MEPPQLRGALCGAREPSVAPSSNSLNSATVRISQAVGLPVIVETGRAFGFGASLTPVPAVALGAFEVTPLELAGAYLPFASGGRPPRLDPCGARGRSSRRHASGICPRQARDESSYLPLKPTS